MISAPFWKVFAVLTQVMLFATAVALLLKWQPVDALNNSLMFHALLELIRARHEREGRRAGGGGE